jgi:hypothetical protein
VWTKDLESLNQAVAWSGSALPAKGIWSRMETTDEVVACKRNCVLFKVGAKGRSNKLFVKHFSHGIVLSRISSCFLANIVF